MLFIIILIVCLLVLLITLGCWLLLLLFVTSNHWLLSIRDGVCYSWLLVGVGVRVRAVGSRCCLLLLVVACWLGCLCAYCVVPLLVTGGC